MRLVVPGGLAACLLALASAGQVVAEGGGMPDAFQGSFVPAHQPCDRDQLILVSALGVEVAGMTLRVTELTLDPQFPDWLLVTLAEIAGPGIETVVLVLAPDGQSLRVWFGDGTDLVWNRCL